MWQNRFKKIDQDGDGKITKDELKASLPQNGKGPSVDELFTKMDTNQDGTIDAEEGKVGFGKMHKHHGGRRSHGVPDPVKLAEAIFKKADADEDGMITVSELTTALGTKASDSNAADIFKAADADQDGAITQTELTDSIKKMMEAMRQMSALASAKDSGASSYNQTGSNTATSDQGSLSMLA
jgi:Ca2+-binding EF-hand superfamily protein